jgi:hypothetical protein
MFERRDGSNFFREPIGADGSGQVWFENLDCDVPIVFQIACEVDGGHPSRANLAIDTIAGGQRIGERPRHFRHAGAYVTSLCRAILK